MALGDALFDDAPLWLVGFPSANAAYDKTLPTATALTMPGIIIRLSNASSDLYVSFKVEETAIVTHCQLYH
tara:strand:+ start:73 stop:285 length:213 start_codon:yes stop_codon:yes gene_type:complete